MTEIDEDELAEFNLSVLRRIDSQVESILFSGGHVSVYDFDQKTKKWDHKDVKGPLFVLKRSNPEAKYVFIVLNRLQIKTLAEEYGRNLKFENTSKYLLYENGVDGVKSISGIWFYDAKLKDEFYELSQRIMDELTSGIDVDVEEEEEEELAPSVANIFRSATATPSFPSFPVPSPATNPRKIDVNTLFGNVTTPPTQNGVKINVGDLFQPRPTASHVASPFGVTSSVPLPSPYQLQQQQQQQASTQRGPFPVGNPSGNPHASSALLQLLQKPPVVESRPTSISPQQLFSAVAPQPTVVPVKAVQVAPNSVVLQSVPVSSLLPATPQISTVPVPKKTNPLFFSTGQAPSATEDPVKSRSWFPNAEQAAPSTVNVPAALNVSSSAPPPGFTPDASPALSRNRVIANPNPTASTPIIKAAVPQTPANSVSSLPDPKQSRAVSTLTKEQLRDAIVKLLHNDAFIDAIYGAYCNSAALKK